MKTTDSVATQLDSEKIQEQSASITDPTTGDFIEVSFLKVTPLIAEGLLRRNHPNNRALNRRTLANYTSVIQAGKWIPTAGEIRISKSGVLLDGQHRLKSVVISGKPVVMMFLRGLAERVILAVDNGKPRTLRDALTISGRRPKGGVGYEGSVLALKHLHDSMIQSKSYDVVAALKSRSNTELVDFHDALKDYEAEAVRFAKQYKGLKQTSSFTRRLLLTLNYLLRGHNSETLSVILRSIEANKPLDGKGTSSPIYHVLNYLNKKKETRTRVIDSDQINIFLWLFTEVARGADATKMPTNIPWLPAQKGFPCVDYIMRKMRNIEC